MKGDGGDIGVVRNVPNNELHTLWMPVMSNHMSKQHRRIPKNIGLALGSGSARGWAHIGVLRALADAGIAIQHVAGTSMGSLVGAAFALGKLDNLELFARQLDWKQIVSLMDMMFPRSGLIDGNKLTSFFRSHAQNIDIKNLPIPFRAVATELARGKEIIIGSGDLVDAIRASISIPGIFTPVKRNEMYLVDGGLVNPVPVSVARNMGAEFIIAVDLHADNISEFNVSEKRNKRYQQESQDDKLLQWRWKVTSKFEKTINNLGSPVMEQAKKWLISDTTPSIFDVVTGSINIVESKITEIRLAIDPPDLLLQPKVGYIRSLEFNRANEAIEEGYQEAVSKLRSSFFS